MASAGATVEILEGRQLFAATVNAAQETAGVADVPPVEVALASGAPDSTSWHGSAGDASVGDTAGPVLSLSRGELTFEAPTGGGMGAIQVLTIHNTGAAPFTIPADGLSVSGRHAALFQILVSPVFPATLPPGGSLEVPMVFSPGTGEARGAKQAQLCIGGNDPAAVIVRLSGSVGEALGDESLGRILSF